MRDIFLVSLGGFLGTFFRYSIYLFFSNTRMTGYFSTLAVNLVGCFLLGYLTGKVGKIDAHLARILMMGVCGGFTTYSTFMMDFFKLTTHGIYLEGLGYLFLSIVLGYLFCYLGYLLP